MKKTILTLTLCIGLLHLGYSQLSSVSYSEEIPESQSVTETGVFSPQFTNSFVYHMAHGLTIFNQTHEMMLFDNKTMAITKKIAYPEYKEYSIFKHNNQRDDRYEMF